MIKSFSFKQCVFFSGAISSFLLAAYATGYQPNQNYNNSNHQYNNSNPQYNNSNPQYNQNQNGYQGQGNNQGSYYSAPVVPVPYYQLNNPDAFPGDREENNIFRENEFHPQ